MKFNLKSVEPVEPAPVAGLEVEALPAVMRGVDGVVEALGASEAFVRTWMDMPEGGAVPPMPCYQMLGNRVFPTRRVVAWLDEFFLFGAGGRPVSQRPPERRGVKGRKKITGKAKNTLNS